MSVIGIDIGTSVCVVASVGKGAVNIVRNDLSERLTPSLVGFTDKERLLGEAALSQIKSNFRNTCSNLKLLLGRLPDEPEVERERQYSLATLDAAEDGSAGFRVNYKGEERVFSAPRVVAMLMTKLKETAEKFNGLPVKDCVIAVPGWFADVHRRAMLSAAEIAGLNCLRVINEHTATALDYGIYRSATFHETEPHHVAFLAAGHSYCTVAVVRFLKGQLTVLGEAHDTQLGGRDMDMLIMKHFAEPFDKKHGTELLKNLKARLKMEDMTTKAKKILSTNMEAGFSVECVLEDFDIAGNITRAEFEKLCAPLVPRFQSLMEKALAESGLTKEQIHVLELVGGATRVPWLQDCAVKYFGRELSRTLNLDETIAKGCALQAAMLSPLFRVREFQANDVTFSPVSVSWTSAGGASSGMEVDEEGGAVATGGASNSSVLFPHKSPLNVVKSLTFMRSAGFDLQAQYADPATIPAGSPADLGRYSVQLPARADGSAQKVKVKAKLTLHGTFQVDSAALIEEEEVPETLKLRRDQLTPEELAALPPAAEGTESKPEDVVEVVRMKKKAKRTDLPIAASVRRGVLNSQQVREYHEAELEMANDDRVQQETREQMNELESYVYKMRAALSESGDLRDFSRADERNALLEKLQGTEDWLYDNFDANKSTFMNKLKELKALGDPIVRREREYKGRNEMEASLSSTLATARGLANSTDASYAHIAQSKKQQILDECEKTEKTVHDLLTRQRMKELYDEPIVTVAGIQEKITALQKLTNSIMSEPKPAPPKEEAKPPQSPQKEGAAPMDTDAPAGDAGAQPTA